MKSLIVIPARLKSSRLNEKLLLKETGKPLIQHTYEAATKSELADGVLVAADDERIAAVVEGFGGNVRLTSPTHSSGTDRLAEVAAELNDVELFVNLQGDEPEVRAEDIDAAIQALQSNPRAQMSTLATPIRDLDALMDPSCVKVIFDEKQRAIYFSRHAIPYARDGFEEAIQKEPPIFHQHVGLYVFHREFLLKFPSLERPAAEGTEMLEQLRAIHNGAEIMVHVIQQAPRGIDTAEDYAAFVTRQMT